MPAYSPYRQTGSSGRWTRTEPARTSAIRIAVCIGTEKAHAVGPIHEGGVPGLDGDVESSHVVSRGPQHRRRRGHVHRLVSEP